MKRKRLSEEQIIAIVKEHKAGVATAELCRKHSVSSARFCACKGSFSSGLWDQVVGVMSRLA